MRNTTDKLCKLLHKTRSRALSKLTFVANVVTCYRIIMTILPQDIDLNSLAPKEAGNSSVLSKPMKTL